MPSYIVKVNKDEDFYVQWSEITDSPYCWGPRTEVEQAMKDFGYDISPDRFDRADATGTSALPGFYNWEDSGFVFEQKGYLKRGDLKAFLETYDEETGKFDESFLEPFEDDA